jgi:hypothetical protein
MNKIVTRRKKPEFQKGGLEIQQKYKKKTMAETVTNKSSELVGTSS